MADNFVARVMDSEGFSPVPVGDSLETVWIGYKFSPSGGMTQLEAQALLEAQLRTCAFHSMDSLPTIWREKDIRRSSQVKVRALSAVQQAHVECWFVHGDNYRLDGIWENHWTALLAGDFCGAARTLVDSEWHASDPFRVLRIATAFAGHAIEEGAKVGAVNQTMLKTVQARNKRNDMGIMKPEWQGISG